MFPVYMPFIYAHPFPKIKDLYVYICFLIYCGACVKHLFNGNGNLHVAFSSKMNSHFSGHVLFLFRSYEPIGTGAIFKPGGMAATDNNANLNSSRRRECSQNEEVL